MEHPKLRDSKKLLADEPYSINEFPDDLIVRIGGYLVYLLYIGRKDISGSDWGDAFADSVGGMHLDSPWKGIKYGEYMFYLATARLSVYHTCACPRKSYKVYDKATASAYKGRYSKSP